jgi:hypothetical protein
MGLRKRTKNETSPQQQAISLELGEDTNLKRLPQNKVSETKRAKFWPSPTVGSSKDSIRHLKEVKALLPELL